MNKILCFVRITVVVIAFCASQICFSQGFKNPPDGTAALSQSGAFIAQCDDPSAISHNIAGLTQLQGTNILIGNTFLFSNTGYSGVTGSADKKYAPAYLPYLYFCSDFNKPNCRFGIGLSSPYGGSTKWDQNQAAIWSANPADPIPYYYSMQMADVTLAFAYKFNQEVSAGIGFNSYFSRMAVNYWLPPLLDKVQFKGTGFGFAPSAGFLFAKPKYRIGLRYNGAFKIKYDSKFRIPKFSIDIPGNSEIEFPHVAGIGIAFFPTDKLKIETDVEWLGFSCVDTISANVSGFDLSQKTNWKDVYTFALGAEYKKSKTWTWRAGIAYVQSPIPDSTFDPRLPDADRIAVSLGTGIKTNIGDFDVGFVASFFKTREINKGKPYDGTYKSRGYFLSVGYKKML